MSNGPSAARMAAGITASALAAFALLGLTDLLAVAVAGHAGALGAGGLLAMLPQPLGGWLSPPPAELWTPGGLATLAGLAGAAAVGGYAAARLGAARLAAAGALLGVTLPLMVWSPLGLVILGGQALVLLLDRTPQRSTAIAQATRVLGLCAAVLVSGGAASPLVVTLLAAALAPSALVALSAPAAAPAAAPAPPEPVSRPDAAAPPEPTPAPALEPDTAPQPDTAPAPKPDTATPGLFGPDPVAALAHLTPAPALVEAARTALANAQPAVLALVRMDGLAGIAEHLGTEGGETLFAAATERLAAALPQAGTLSWVGDETFVALVPVAQADDVADLGPRLAAPFAEDLIIDGRPISMEDALHVEAMMLEEETLEELAGWIRAG